MAPLPAFHLTMESPVSPQLMTSIQSPGKTGVAANSKSAASGSSTEIFPPEPPPLNLEVADVSLRVRVAEKEAASVDGCSLGSSGSPLLHQLLEVLPLRSKTMGNRNSSALFPLPTSRDLLMTVRGVDTADMCTWMICVCMSLNSVWGDELHSNCEPNQGQIECLELLALDVRRLCELDVKIESLPWTDFFRIRGVDYRGEEVKVARRFQWENIRGALPAEVGAIPLSDVCTHGSKFYVEHFDLYLKPQAEWGDIPTPRVMVSDEHWGAVCTGLVQAGVCVLLEESEVFHVGSQPLLNGLFGVPKDEVDSHGFEVFRLIMNLVPLNQLCRPMAGDVDTLPSWGMMSPFFLQPGENLLISSEDVKCFFYTLEVPSCWIKYLAFNKEVPASVLPPGSGNGKHYLASRVLPMGFLNSVSLAQHVHRNIVSLSSYDDAGANQPEQELRKDQPFTVSNPNWRVYLDNYDLLERVEATGMVSLEGEVAPGVLCLRQEYQRWNMPRNEKKAVQRSSCCEMQGALVDGVAGLARPRGTKLAKYMFLAFTLAQQQVATVKEWQVVCGGLVYFSMFRRPLLGCLNRVWSHIESYSSSCAKTLPTPDDCRLELLRFLGLVPLARLDFRLDMDPAVSCSDASTSGGGICVSSKLSALGSVVAQGDLRGEFAEAQTGDMVLTIGLFDGIAALRVAMELQGVAGGGHISVEQHEPASRVVEANWPGTIHVSKVEQVDREMVTQWALKFSQATVVVIGAGPPCQGVSGLNCDRRGALNDQRSSLFSHVPRIRRLVQEAFAWCVVHSLMESVASMDQQDQDVMSSGFGTQPIRCDAGSMTWCRRPRLYWLSWPLQAGDGAECTLTERGLEEWCLTSDQPITPFIAPGWTKVDCTESFPTFTTSRPSHRPGRKPAGIQQCTEEELRRWHEDLHRFPPYQYRTQNCLKNRSSQLRIPNVNERELLLGFPLNYTTSCFPKGERKGDAWSDCRLTLLGNSWSVPVVAWLLNQLLSTLGLCPKLNPSQIMNDIAPGNSHTVQGRLLRLPLHRPEPQSSDALQLARKLGNLVSLKGEDLMLQASHSQQVKFQRLRASVPAKLWRWKIVSGWQWRSRDEHINALELRAILTAMKWRFEHQRHFNRRIIHLTDSLVCLHCLTRGRSSSRKLRRTMSRINALLLVSNTQVLWGYVSTDSNPADKPSRWGRRVRTRFRNG
eukprot:Skav213726  [mRNA]  locus=scaffold2563:64713:68294:+ [translate_table: standard]